jgi:hypothetical protein
MIYCLGNAFYNVLQTILNQPKLLKMKKLQFALLLLTIGIGTRAQIFTTPTTLSPAIPALPYIRNVGIGVSQPAGGLHIRGGLNTLNSGTFILERKDNPVTNQNNLLTVGFSSNVFSSAITGGGSCAFMLNNPYNTADMAFSTNRSAPQLIIKPNGNVGINTTTPLQRLHVHNGGILISGTTTGFGGPQLIFSDNLATYPNGRWALEYLSPAPSRPSMGGMNFWRPFSPGAPLANYYLFLKDDGKIGMGVTDDNTDPNFCANAFPGNYRLYVKGGILTDKIKIAVYCSSQWADYVFAPEYKLRPLDEVEAFARANKHLPGVPSAEEIVNDGGIDVNQMFAKQMEKIEELTLYMIALKKENGQLQKDIQDLKVSIVSPNLNK